MPVGRGNVAALSARLAPHPAPVRVALVAALDEWVDLASAADAAGIREPDLAWLRRLVAALDDDPWRREVREAGAMPEGPAKRSALVRLAARADVDRQPPLALTSLARRIRHSGRPRRPSRCSRGPTSATRPTSGSTTTSGTSWSRT